MNRILMAHLLCLMGLISVGCGGPEYTGDKRYAISGTVTVDGEPMQWGTISFIPKDGNNRVSGGPIIDGKFEVTEGRGANSGEYRVEIRWQKPTGKQVRDIDTDEMIDELAEGLPARYHKDSELTASVSEENQTFTFDLKSAEGK